MNRKALLESLTRYQTLNKADEFTLRKFKNFVQTNPNCFSRKLLKGHVTGSCWLLEPSETKILLTHHKKLNKWIQLGGHADENPNMLEVSLREACEESGIENIVPYSQEILSLDIHEIPEWKEEPTHWHYDVTFALKAPTEKFVMSDESHDLKWVEIEKIPHMDLENTLKHMYERWKKFKTSAI